MVMETQNMEERLWDYIDGTCNEQEKSFIEQLIDSNLEWKAKYKELLDVHTLMQTSLELDEPSLRFRQNVMEEIAKYHIAPATRTYINKNVVRGIGAFFILMIIGLFVYSFGQVNWNDGSGSIIPVDISTFDWSKVFNNAYVNVFLMVNIVLGLVLLDMYLNKKKKSQEEMQ